jgi:hypothetical protein
MSFIHKIIDKARHEPKRNFFSFGTKEEKPKAIVEEHRVSSSDESVKTKVEEKTPGKRISFFILHSGSKNSPLKKKRT